MNRKYAPPRQHRGRSGFTLRELSIAMTIGTTVLGSSIGMLHHAFDWTRIAQHRRQDDQTYFAFARQLRTDLHAARDVSVSEDALEVTLAAENDVRYRIADNTIERVETRGDDQSRSETYRWKRPRAFRFQSIDGDGQIECVGKSITPHPQDQVPVWRQLRVTVGLRNRYQQGDVQ
jgi:type II secretory pathway component PulJ